MQRFARDIATADPHQLAHYTIATAFSSDCPQYLKVLSTISLNADNRQLYAHILNIPSIGVLFHPEPSDLRTVMACFAFSAMRQIRCDPSTKLSQMTKIIVDKMTSRWRPPRS